MNERRPWNPITKTVPKVQPLRKVARWRRASDIPEGVMYILDICQHEVPKPTPDVRLIACPFCPGE